MRVVLLAGVMLWLGGTVLIRLVGQWVLLPDRPDATMLLYVASFVVMAGVARLVYRSAGVPTAAWPAAATLLMLPTLLLDPITCVFFPTVFPNVDPAAAGIFGGWMLACCGGGVAGAWLLPPPALNPTVHLSGQSHGSLIRSTPAQKDGSSSRWILNPSELRG